MLCYNLKIKDAQKLESFIMKKLREYFFKPFIHRTTHYSNRRDEAYGE